MFSEQTALADFKSKLNREIDKKRDELLVIKTGKASPALIEGLIVETYNATMKLKLVELASIATEGPSGLVILPFDPSTVTDIEKAILSSPLNLTPRVDGKDIHIKIPALTQEQRMRLIKTVSQKIEEGREQVRFARDEIRKKIRAAAESKFISEDVKFKLEKEVDKIAQEMQAHLEQLKQKKEKEMMEV